MLGEATARYTVLLKQIIPVAALVALAAMIDYELPATAHGLRIVLTVACAVATVLGCAYTLFSGLLVGPYFRRPIAALSEYPAVTVLRPLHGHEHALLENLSSFYRQDYPAPVQFVFGVHSQDDPALQIVEALRSLHPDMDLTVIIDPQLHGPNRKISNILNMLPNAKHDVLVFADSDVAAAPDSLSKIVASLHEPGVGLVSCLYRGQADPGFWPSVSAAASNYHFMPGVVTGLTLRLARPCLGPTIAMRRETLLKIGGLTPFAQHLAEDHAIGEAVRALSEQVALPSVLISHACVEPTFRSFFLHKLRAGRTIRGITPMGYLGSVITHPLPLAMATAWLAGAAPWSLGLLLVALAVRFALGINAERAMGRRFGELWALPICDLVLFLAFVASFSSRNVVWRGYHFQADGNGHMTPAE